MPNHPLTEADNELHHLLIMEALGGAEVPIDRLLAGNAAFFYYWMVVFMYIVNPRGAYHLSQVRFVCERCIPCDPKPKTFA